MTKPTLLAKMSYKTVCGKINRKEIPEGGKLFVMRIIGQAVAMGTGNSDYGAFTFFKGSFEGTNVATGEVFRSGKLFLPTMAQTLLEGALSGSGNVNAVDFGFDIFVVESDNAIGYEYSAESLLEVSESDPVSVLKKQIAGGAPALPEPTKPAATQAALPVSSETVAETAPVATAKKK